MGNEDFPLRREKSIRFEHPVHGGGPPWGSNFASAFYLYTAIIFDVKLTKFVFFSLIHYFWSSHQKTGNWNRKMPTLILMSNLMH